jgi:hypothetical protein
LKIYTSTVEGLLLNNPAAILHMGQTLKVEHDTVDVLTAVTKGELVLKTVVNTPEPLPTSGEHKSEEPKQPEGETGSGHVEGDLEKQQRDARNKKQRGK